jgi:hypothetical protein
MTETEQISEKLKLSRNNIIILKVKITDAEVILSILKELAKR